MTRTATSVTTTHYQSAQKAVKNNNKLEFDRWVKRFATASKTSNSQFAYWLIVGQYQPALEELIAAVPIELDGGKKIPARQGKKSPGQRSLLMKATMDGNLAAVNTLIHAGANPDLRSISHLANNTYQQHRPVEVAYQINHPDIFLSLAKHSALKVSPRSPMVYKLMQAVRDLMQQDCQRVDLSNIAIGDIGLEILAAAIKQYRGPACDIHIENCGASDIGAEKFAQALAEQPTVKALYCGHNLWSMAAVELIAAELSALPSLTELSLTHLPVSQRSTMAVCAVLKQPECHLIQLDLSDCQLGYRQARQLSDSLQTTRAQLSDLNLSDNKLTDFGVVRCLRAFKANTSLAESLTHFSYANTGANEKTQQAITFTSGTYAVSSAPHCTATVPVIEQSKLDAHIVSIAEKVVRSLKVYQEIPPLPISLDDKDPINYFRISCDLKDLLGEGKQHPREIRHPLTHMPIARLVLLQGNLYFQSLQDDVTLELTLTNQANAEVKSLIIDAPTADIKLNTAITARSLVSINSRALELHEASVIQTKHTQIDADKVTLNGKIHDVSSKITANVYRHNGQSLHDGKSLITAHTVENLGHHETAGQALIRAQHYHNFSSAKMIAGVSLKVRGTASDRLVDYIDEGETRAGVYSSVVAENIRVSDKHSTNRAYFFARRELLVSEQAKVVGYEGVKLVAGSQLKVAGEVRQRHDKVVEKLAQRLAAVTPSGAATLQPGCLILESQYIAVEKGACLASETETKCLAKTTLDMRGVIQSDKEVTLRGEIIQQDPGSCIDADKSSVEAKKSIHFGGQNSYKTSTQVKAPDVVFEQSHFVGQEAIVNADNITDNGCFKTNLDMTGKETVAIGSNAAHDLGEYTIASKMTTVKGRFNNRKTSFYGTHLTLDETAHIDTAGLGVVVDVAEFKACHVECKAAAIYGSQEVTLNKDCEIIAEENLKVTAKKINCDARLVSDDALVLHGGYYREVAGSKQTKDPVLEFVWDGVVELKTKSDLRAQNLSVKAQKYSSQGKINGKQKLAIDAENIHEASLDLAGASVTIGASHCIRFTEAARTTAKRIDVFSPAIAVNSTDYQPQEDFNLIAETATSAMQQLEKMAKGTASYERIKTTGRIYFNKDAVVNAGAVMSNANHLNYAGKATATSLKFISRSSPDIQRGAVLNGKKLLQLQTEGNIDSRTIDFISDGLCDIRCRNGDFDLQSRILAVHTHILAQRNLTIDCTVGEETQGSARLFAKYRLMLDSTAHIESPQVNTYGEEIRLDGYIKARKSANIKFGEHFTVSPRGICSVVETDYDKENPTLSLLCSGGMQLTINADGASFSQKTASELDDTPPYICIKGNVETRHGPIHMQLPPKPIDDYLKMTSGDFSALDRPSYLSVGKNGKITSGNSFNFIGDEAWVGGSVTADELAKFNCNKYFVAGLADSDTFGFGYVDAKTVAINASVYVNVLSYLRGTSALITNSFLYLGGGFSSSHNKNMNTLLTLQEEVHCVDPDGLLDSLKPEEIGKALEKIFNFEDKLQFLSSFLSLAQKFFPALTWLRLAYQLVSTLVKLVSIKDNLDKIQKRIDRGETVIFADYIECIVSGMQLAAKGLAQLRRHERVIEEIKKSETEAKGLIARIKEHYIPSDAIGVARTAFSIANQCGIMPKVSQSSVMRFSGINATISGSVVRDNVYTQTASATADLGLSIVDTSYIARMGGYTAAVDTFISGGEITQTGGRITGLACSMVADSLRQTGNGATIDIAGALSIAGNVEQQDSTITATKDSKVNVTDFKQKGQSKFVMGKKKSPTEPVTEPAPKKSDNEETKPRQYNFKAKGDIDSADTSEFTIHEGAVQARNITASDQATVSFDPGTALLAMGAVHAQGGGSIILDELAECQAQALKATEGGDIDMQKMQAMIDDLLLVDAGSTFNARNVLIDARNVELAGQSAMADTDIHTTHTFNVTATAEQSHSGTVRFISDDFLQYEANAYVAKDSVFFLSAANFASYHADIGGAGHTLLDYGRGYLSSYIHTASLGIKTNAIDDVAALIAGEGQYRGLQPTDALNFTTDNDITLGDFTRQCDVNVTAGSIDVRGDGHSTGDIGLMSTRAGVDTHGELFAQNVHIKSHTYTDYHGRRHRAREVFTTTAGTDIRGDRARLQAQETFLHADRNIYYRAGQINSANYTQMTANQSIDVSGLARQVGKDTIFDITRINSGAGIGYDGIGTNILAENQFISGATCIESLGTNQVVGRKGMHMRAQIGERHSTRHHNRWYGSKAVKANEQVAYATSFLSTLGNNQFDTNGNLQAEGAKFVALTGKNQAHAGGDIRLNGVRLKKSEKATRHYQNKFSLIKFETKSRDKTETSESVTFYDQGAELSAGGQIIGEGIQMLGSGTATFTAPKGVDLISQTLNHSSVKHEWTASFSGLGSNMINAAMHGTDSTFMALLKEDPTVAAALDLLKSENALDAIAGGLNLGTNIYNGLANIAEAKADGSLASGIRERYGLGGKEGFDYKFGINVGHTRHKAKWQTLDNSGIHKDELVFNCGETGDVRFLNGIPVSAGKMTVNARNLDMQGARLESSHKSQGETASLATSAKGDFVSVGGGYNEQNSKGVRYQNQQSNIGHLTLNLAGGWNLDAANAKIGHLEVVRPLQFVNVRSRQDSHRTKGYSVHVTSGGDVSGSVNYQSSKRVGQQAGIHITGSATGFETATATLTGAYINVPKPGDFKSAHTVNIELKDRDKGGHFNFSGNVHQFNGQPANGRNPIKTVQVGMGGNRYQATRTAGVQYAASTPGFDPSNVRDMSFSVRRFDVPISFSGCAKANANIREMFTGQQASDLTLASATPDSPIVFQDDPRLTASCEPTPEVVDKTELERLVTSAADSIAQSDSDLAKGTLVNDEPCPPPSFNLTDDGLGLNNLITGDAPVLPKAKFDYTPSIDPVADPLLPVDESLFSRLKQTMSDAVTAYGLAHYGYQTDASKKTEQLLDQTGEYAKQSASVIEHGLLGSASGALTRAFNGSGSLEPLDRSELDMFQRAVHGLSGIVGDLPFYAAGAALAVKPAALAGPAGIVIIGAASFATPTLVRESCESWIKYRENTHPEDRSVKDFLNQHAAKIIQPAAKSAMDGAFFAAASALIPNSVLIPTGMKLFDLAAKGAKGLAQITSEATLLTAIEAIHEQKLPTPEKFIDNSFLVGALKAGRSAAFFNQPAKDYSPKSILSEPQAESTLAESYINPGKRALNQESFWQKRDVRQQNPLQSKPSKSASNASTLPQTHPRLAQQLRKNLIVDYKASNLAGQQIHHGATEGVGPSIKLGPKNIAKNTDTGGTGLYVSPDAKFAGHYANFAARDAKAESRPYSEPKVFTGRFNPDASKPLRVGKITIARRGDPISIENGAWPINWPTRYPELHQFLLQECDILEVNLRGNNEMVKDSTYYVIHESAGSDAVHWAPDQPLPTAIQEMMDSAKSSTPSAGNQ